jgi:hypothetical protein
MRRFNSSRSSFGNAAGAIALLLYASLALQAQSAGGRNAGVTSEQRTARYFESIRKSPPQMFAFLKRMPKGW